MNLSQAALLAAASFAAGAINSVAGGGTLVSFPAAIAVGLSPLSANATNAVALTPGQIAAAFAYRRELGRDRAVVRLFLPAAAIGGVIGSLLLLFTPQKIFAAIVPLLVLFATALLVAQNLRKPSPVAIGAEAEAGWALPKNPAIAVLAQLLVGVYGGYFGAGMGIMMLAIYARLGAADIHRMNGVKAVIGAVINAIASAAFVVAGIIDYRAAAVMAVGAIVGGFAGAAASRRVKPSIVRWGVVAVGIVLSIELAYKQWG
jgi:uncharacterized protein